MYRINPLGRKVLITTDEVIFHAPTKHTLDPRGIEQSIIVAEERFISHALGYDFYYQLLDQKNTVVTPANKAALQAEIDNALPPNAQLVILREGDIVNASENLNGENAALWSQHLWKLTAECVVFLSIAEGYVQFGSEGTIHAQPPAGPINNTSVVSPELKAVRWAMDKKMMDRIDPLLEAMHMWVCREKKSNPARYPLYEKACDCNTKGIAYKRKTDIILGIYDDEDEKCHCR